MPPAVNAHVSLIDSIGRHVDLSADDRAMLDVVPLRAVTLISKSEILVEGDEPTDSCLILSGALCRYRILSGGSRQILSFHFAGDMPDLQSLYLNRVDHSMCALTTARVAFASHDALRNAATQQPRIAKAFATHALVEASILREWIVNIGRRAALPRMAHLFFCEFYLRLTRLNLATGDGMYLPLTQADLADATGLSAVHVNRVLQALRATELIESNGRHHKIRDWARLQLAAGFDERYLHLRPNSARA